MTRHNLIAFLIGLFSSIITIIFGVGAFILENYLFFSGVALFLAGTIACLGSFLGYFYHSRFGGLLMLLGTGLYFFALLILNTYYSDFYFYQEVWMNIVTLFLVLMVLVASILYLYPHPLHKGVKDKPNNNIFVLLGSILCTIFLVIVIIQQYNVEYYLSALACALTIILLLGGLVISFKYHSRFGSLLMSASLWFALFGVIVLEINASNLAIIFMLLAQTILVVTILLEWIDSIILKVKE